MNELSHTDNTKFFGLIIDNISHGNEYVKKVVSKISSELFALRRMSRKRNII